MDAHWYSDNSKQAQPVFIAVCETMAEADEMFKEQIGFDVSKKSHIGCEIKFNINIADYE